MTGGAGGIGRATAELLVAEGASVVIADIDADEGQGVAPRIGDAAAFRQTDVSDIDQVQALVDFAVERFGGLDIMFNNAGIGSPLKRFLPDDLEDFSRIMNVNLFGVIAGSQRAGAVHEGPRRGIHHQQRLHRRHQRRRRHDLVPGIEGGGRPCTKCMAIDLAPYGIRVNCLTPAHIRTGITTYEMGPVLQLHAAARTRGPARRCRQRSGLPLQRAGGADHRRSCSRSTAGRQPARPTRRRS